MPPRQALVELMDEGWQPPPVDDIESTGLNQGFLSDTALKIMYFRGVITGYEIAEQMRLPFQTVMQPIMEFLKREQFCEVKGSGGLGVGAYQYVITSKGAARAREQLERTTYIGPAPVPWDDYVAAIKAQGSRRLRVNQQMMRQALAHLVLDERVFHKIGPAVNSGRSIFLYGPPGNGKTTIAESVGRMVLGNDMYIPYAVEVDGLIIKVYDEINHEVVEESKPSKMTTGSLGSNRIDARWIRIRRPVIMVGGELMLDGLDLIYDTNNKFYEAPYQMKANGGMFLIDDFGRQQVRPRDLLNRWIVPMEKNVDFLALHTGRKIEVPFNVLLVFSTNLPPGDLVDEAFLRRIRHKIEITSPSFESYREIFKRICEWRKIPFDDQAVRYLLQEYYVKKNRKLRANHPRDLVDQIMDIGSYMGTEPTLTKELLDRAAEAYFVDL
ncbi:MAG: AAA family ATPase [Chloroflexi bacterium]|nr:AAA family ATPase [Chloroflexota bacterium]MCI0577990.1 AAA family ATPase [Chloroflexota bacterium]MCI0646981.1 AAA family ATPase [Chloroflexota bacterium]MCI0729260.1 AAA family ATPase [Chloroflexota bacterium]